MKLHLDECAAQRQRFESFDHPRPDLSLRILDGAIIMVVLLCFLVLLTWMQNRDTSDLTCRPTTYTRS